MNMKMIDFAIKAAVLIATVVCSARTASAFYDPGMQQWLNRDPLADLGFQTTRTLRTSLFHSRDWRSYQYVFNEPLRFFDAFGLIPIMAPPSSSSGAGGGIPPIDTGGGGGADCESLGEKAAAAWDAAIANPDNINLQLDAALASAAFIAAGCGEDIEPPPRICPPPDNPGPPEPPSWLRRIGRGIGSILDGIPVLIGPPIQIICPNCVPSGPPKKA